MIIFINYFFKVQGSANPTPLRKYFVLTLVPLLVLGCVGTPAVFLVFLFTLFAWLKMTLVSCIKEHDAILCNGIKYVLEEDPLNYKDSWFWIYLGIYVFLVLFAGKFVELIKIVYASQVVYQSNPRM